MCPLKMSIRQMSVSLYRAIKINYIEKVRELLRKNPDILKQSVSLSVQKYSPLWEAMIQGRKEIVEVCVEFGADPDEQCSVEHRAIPNDAKYTFLQFLASGEFSLSSVEMVELLIRLGANVNAFNDKITSPLRIAIEKGIIDYVEILLKNGARLEGLEWNTQSPIFYVLKNKNIDLIEKKKMLLLLLNYNLDTNFANSKGEGLLHVLVSNLNYYDDGVETAEILINAGVQLEFKNFDGFSPLHYAVDRDQPELVSIFLKRGADVNAKNNNGQTPLFYSYQGDDEDIIQLLLRYGADINAKDIYGTPLHEACICGPGKMDMIIFLIRNGADVDEYDNYNHSPIDLLMINSYGEDELIMKEIAKLNFENPLINLRFLDRIKYGGAYYESYIEELSLMANTKFYPPYSYHCVMMMSKNMKKLARLTKNEEFITNFKMGLHKFSKYKDDLERIFNEAIEFKNDSHIVYSRLSSVFGDFLPSLVIRKIADYMTVRGLQIL